MNTRKQVLIMTGLLFMMLIILGLYAAWYPYRETSAATDFSDLTANRGAILFARNCRLCHGDVGEGGALGARYAGAPALDRADLQGFTDISATISADLSSAATTVQVNDASKLKAGQTIAIDDERLDVKAINGKSLTVERGTGHSDPSNHQSGASLLLLDPDALKGKISLITNTITCGRVGTAMPAWGQSQGGPLSDEQMRQLMTVITQNRWSLVKAEDDNEDKLLTKLTAAMSEDTISMQVSDTSVFNKDDAIRIGDERIRITAVPKLDPKNKDKSGVVQVQRGILGTAPLAHDVTEQIYHFPETAEPAINAASCGQTAQAPAAAGTPSLVEPFDGQTVTVVAQNISYDKKEIDAKAGGKIRVRLDNRDNATDHNIAFYKSSTDTTPVSTGSVGVRYPGPGQDDTVFDVPAAGTYYFRCDVHPTIMFGKFVVTP